MIDLTKDDAELASHSSTVADDSDDSLNLRAEEPPKMRIADDGRATQRLKEDHRGGGPSKAVDVDTEIEQIDEFPVLTRKEGKVRNMARNIEEGKVRGMARNPEHTGGKSHAPKLDLSTSNPLASLLTGKPKSKVRLFTENGG